MVTKPNDLYILDNVCIISTSSIMDRKYNYEFEEMKSKVYFYIIK